MLNLRYGKLGSMIIKGKKMSNDCMDILRVGNARIVKATNRNIQAIKRVASIGITAAEAARNLNKALSALNGTVPQNEGITK